MIFYGQGHFIKILVHDLDHLLGMIFLHKPCEIAQIRKEQGHPFHFSVKGRAFGNDFIPDLLADIFAE